ncbi:hypothetical protein [Dactylococcopsis salina]|uniref:hypothetical protein n=1 Tax=Dactylococcopsis salina TaxID=292566 RepID=UPI0012E9A487|nr:hypothetical protein [Dactylococcopsis salina]
MERKSVVSGDNSLFKQEMTTILHHLNFWRGTESRQFLSNPSNSFSASIASYN